MFEMFVKKPVWGEYRCTAQAQAGGSTHQLFRLKVRSSPASCSLSCSQQTSSCCKLVSSLSVLKIKQAIESFVSMDGKPCKHNKLKVPSSLESCSLLSYSQQTRSPIHRLGSLSSQKPNDSFLNIPHEHWTASKTWRASLAKSVLHLCSWLQFVGLVWFVW